jgi:serine/threonine protein kinase/Tol biopolymer transport system component
MTRLAELSIMKPEQWQQAREVLADALELKPEDRPAFLDRVCSSDNSLRREVERLLSSSEEARSSFLQSSAIRVTLMAGEKLGDYEVQRLLGSGGMGEVYRAHDTRLGRDVAIKVLPTFLSHDPDRLRRFEQEARAAAALNHQNILAVHQLGTYEGAPYLVSELLEGVTLREQLVRSPMPLRKAIECGVQIARGLAAAHEKGIVHRDLKPENLFVTKDGRVKILDFGLAKLIQRPTTFDHNAPTVSEGTEPGVVMGTVGYMSPEQVCGNAPDHRADIFAFGAILYEMLVGKRAFQKPTSAETMSAILNEDPPGISQIVPNLPPGLQRVAHRCLEKNPEQRFQSASDLAFALDALSDSGRSSDIGIAQMSSRSVYWWAAAAVILVISALVAILYLPRSSRTITTPTLTRLTWDSGLTTDPALSPDGKLLAYASDRSGEGHLDIYVQQVGGGEPLRLTRGPGDKREPAFSPDGTTIAFDSADGGLYLVSALGGTARKLMAEGHGAQFSPDGKRIAYWRGGTGGVAFNIPGEARMYIVDSSGGTPKQLRADFAAAAFPIWTPDGGHLLFLGNPDASKGETVDWWVTAVDPGPAVKTGVIPALRRARLAGDIEDLYPYEKVVLGRDGKAIILPGRSGDSTNLWRMAFSPTKFIATGLPQRLTSGATREENPSAVHLADGTSRVAFTSFSESLAVWSLTIQPGQGKAMIAPEQLTHDAAGDFMPAISRDGSKIVFVSTRPGQQEVWTKDLRSGQESQVTATRLWKWDPKFSPDGSQIAFAEFDQSSDRNVTSVFVVPSGGGAPEVVCPECGEVTDWSPDGKRIIGNTADGRTWILDPVSHAKRDLLATQHWIAADSFSPDGRWFSFVEIGPGGERAYVAPASEQPVPESAWIAVMDGEAWAWSHDGNLLYVTSWRDGHLCIWARHLHPLTKQPMGEPFAVFHSHSTRLSLSNQIEHTLGVAGNKLIFSMGERTGNIWMAEWKDQ